LTINQGSQVGNVVNIGAIGDAGDITIKTKNLNLAHGARLNASTFGKGNAGTITINADNVWFDGVGSTINYLGNTSIIFTGALSRVEGNGNGGDINISTKNLHLTNGARLYVGIVPGGKGNAGTINITDADNVQFDGVGENGFSSGAFSVVNDTDIGNGVVNNTGIGNGVVNDTSNSNGGNINISTKSLILTNGARLDASTLGRGNAGNIRITGADTVSFDGVGSNQLFSGALSRVENKAIGNGGDITIETKNLNLTDGARLYVGLLKEAKGKAGTINITADNVQFDGVGKNGFSSGAFSYVNEKAQSSDNGSIKITTKNLALTNGAQINSSTSGIGNAGTINITADNVRFDEVGSNGFPSGAFSYVDKEATSSAAAGSIKITTKNLALTNGAKINADNRGQGEVSNLDITGGNKLTLYKVSLPAKSAIGKGGNIVLVVRDILLIREGNISSIGSNTGPTFEGDICIKVETLVLHGRSKIRTHAEAPQGGSNINIYRLHRKLVVLVSHGSEIRAAGKLNMEPNLKVQPSVIPQVKLVNPSEQIGQNPCQRGVTSKFIITGRGGLPPSPNDATSSDAVRVDLVEPALAGSRGAGEQRRRDTEEKTKSSVSKPIVPTQGWIFDKNGDVMLTAYDPTGTGSQRPLSPDSCPVP
jgi:large exoprotein involved in heme utilization and adhesion